MLALYEVSKKVPIIFPCPPRTRKMINTFGLSSIFAEYVGQTKLNNGFYIFDPMGYNDFLYLWKDCCGMLTDSGGLQEETTALNVPCITLRENTERPITADEGSNVIVGSDINLLLANISKILDGNFKKGSIPEFWDGNASKRIIKIISENI